MFRADAPTAAVMLSSGAVAQISSIPDGAVSLAVGMIGVWLARWVFVSKENRKIGKPQRWNDTLPLTLVAMLVTAVVIIDRGLGLSASAFTGLGAGWAAVLLLDVLGERILNMLRAGFAVPLPPHIEERADLSGNRGRVINEQDLPPDMIDSLETIEKADRGNGK